ncbi:hypothetical protein niasHT_029646 [Heterodera trifolii]|uniref:CCHC-type domain-containing protein n=1 Tax=Heterodera trifolii TaxID=157864 RepID=A0ABD2K1N0_9BILA
MAFVRSPYLTRQQAANAGIVLNNDGAILQQQNPLEESTESHNRGFLNHRIDPPLFQIDRNSPISPNLTHRNNHGLILQPQMTETELRNRLLNFDAYTAEWPDKKRITALETKVYGRAERAFEAAKATQPFQYALIRRDMMNQLEETDASQLGAFDELMVGVKRGQNETIDSLANRISALVQKAYAGLTQHFCDEYAIKFLIRAMGNPELALNLELARTPGMSLDHFVSLAARAESTQKAARRFTATNSRNADRMNSYDDRGLTFHQNRDFSSRPANAYQRPNSNIRCYNCDEYGHISRYCSRPRSSQNTNWPSTNEESRQIEPRNFRQNCVVFQRNVVHRSNNYIREKCHESKVAEFFKNLETNWTKKEGMAFMVGKTMATQVNVLGLETKAMMDGGAQISLISANFLYKLVIEKNLNLRQANFCKSYPKILDVNGNPLKCLGTVSIPIHRKGLAEQKMCVFNITEAPIGFDLLLGTNILGDLGFRLYDEVNELMIPFEKMNSHRKDFETIIFRTKFECETLKRKKAEEPKKGSKSPKQKKCGGTVSQSAEQKKQRQMEEMKPKFGQRKRTWKPTAKKAQHNQGEMYLQLGTIAQRGRGNGLNDLKIRTQQKKNFVSTVDQYDNRMDSVASDSLGIRVESLGQFLNASRNRADSRRAENRPFGTSRFRPYATDRLHDRTLPNLGNQ